MTVPQTNSERKENKLVELKLNFTFYFPLGTGVKKLSLQVNKRSVSIAWIILLVRRNQGTNHKSQIKSQRTHKSIEPAK